MGISEIISYLSGATGYALLATALAMIAIRICSPHHAGAKTAMLCAAVFFPVFLGLSPFPAPEGLNCAEGGTRPVFRPFAFVDAYVRFWREDRPLSDWLYSLSIISPVMNVVFFALPGIALARITESWRLAFMLACGLTAFIEIAQFSALFGIYPCRYRHFDVDDLILNSTGTLLGFAAMRWWMWRGDMRRVP